jgi:uncharacterized repeat protein (TIGR03803 family)
MKVYKAITHLIIVLAIFGLTSMPRLNAQNFTNLYDFSAPDHDTGFNSDGANPFGGLISDGKKLYGTTYNGGAFGVGTIFAVNINGTCYTNLHSFSGSQWNPNIEGVSPTGSLILSSNTLYGTTYFGGDFNAGTVFKINIDGTGFTNIYTFTSGSDGGNPNSGVILSGNILYGTTFSSPGTIFKVDTDGTGFTNVYAFTGTGNDGNLPSSLILSSNTLYGTTPSGGNFTWGTVFKINIDGSGFTNFYSFTQPLGFGGSSGTNGDGVAPYAGLILLGNRLYGTASSAGTNGFGTVFAVNKDGASFATLYNFTAYQDYLDYQTNSDGANPMTALNSAGDVLYGTTSIGGSSGSGYGTVFTVNTDGSGFMNLHSFSYPDGFNSRGALIFLNNKLYGTASEGGNFIPNSYDPYFDSTGTIFSIAVPPPQLGITLSGANVILSWPTNEIYLNLQSTTNLAFPVWINVNGQNRVTNTISNSKMFYRLSPPAP